MDTCIIIDKAGQFNLWKSYSDIVKKEKNMPNNSYSPGPGAAALLGGFIIVYLVILLAIIVFSVIVYWKIFSKAGYSGAMGLLMFVPIANLVALCILAFGEWPI